jgi:hypothetical protein
MRVDISASFSRRVDISALFFKKSWYFCHLFEDS